MATAKTASFWLTETVTLPNASAAGTRIMGTLDLASYVNVPTGQAIAIEEVDYIIQKGSDYGSEVIGMLAGNGGITTQLTDLNPGTAFVRADNLSLISSGAMNIDNTNSIATNSSDFFPDNFGTLSEARYVVNDTLYITTGNDNAAVASAPLYVTVRVKARVVKLSNKDWMAIAIQSTASDN
tara:strand:+ start:785 stop:1330 length:546 start_codon:yes stop_codon:yes gene_type:complete